jgi:hypothetical protein
MEYERQDKVPAEFKKERSSSSKTIQIAKNDAGVQKGAYVFDLPVRIALELSGLFEH